MEKCFGFIPIRGNSLRKLRLMMKFVFVFMFVTSFQVSAVMSQTKLVSLRLSNASLEEVIQALKSQTDYGFFYNIDSEKIQQVRDITVDMTNVSLTEVLDYILRGTGLTYSIVNDVVIIKESTPAMTRDSVSMEVVAGKVVDEKGMAMPGVNVIIRGTTVGVSTDINGRFRIQAGKQDSLMFSFVGYKTQRIAVSDKKELELVKMILETQGLEEVQIVAYGEQSKREVTGAIESLKADDLKEVPSHNIINLLQGKLAE